MKQISIKKMLESGIPMLGLCNMYPAAGIIERIGPDWDWVWIDGQHGQHDYQSIMSAVRACDLIGKPAIVRVPGHDYGTIGHILDTCASGIMVPMVEDTHQAKAIVEAAKFPPLGRRSYGGRRPIDLYGRAYAHNANEELLVVAQIETKRGLENAEEIAAIPGIDALFFGPDDMSMQDGLPMDKPRELEELKNLMAIMAAAALKHGKFAGITSPSPEIVSEALDMGYLLFVSSGDVPLLVGGSKAARSKYSSAKERIKSGDSQAIY